jgi:hypothetical protein
MVISMIGLRTSTKTLGLVVVGCAFVVFAICFWLLRPNTEAAERIPEARSENRRPSETNIQASQPGDSQLGPVSGELASQERAHVAASQGTQQAETENWKRSEDASPSITYRYNAQLIQEGDTAPSNPLTDRDDGITPATSLVARTQSVVVHNDSQGCKLCTRSNAKGLAIPKGCIYDSHTITQLQRNPYVPVEQTYDKFTEYRETPYVDQTGAVEGVQLSVWVRNEGMTDGRPSITMRLTVAMNCQAE